MLIVEVLSENEETEKVVNGEEAKEEEPHDLDEVLLEERTGSHAAAGPGTNMAVSFRPNHLASPSLHYWKPFHFTPNHKL